MAPTTAATRARPFILVTGVPGAGKTTLADALATRIDAKRIDVGALCAREGFHGAGPLFGPEGNRAGLKFCRLPCWG